MNRLEKLRNVALASLFVFLSGVPVRALDPNQPAGSFLRTHFTPDNGGFPGTVVDHVLQTNDGFLWVITNRNNLSRFDGKNFFNLTSPRPATMTTAPNGDLWLGTGEDLIHMPAAGFSKFTLSGLTSYHPVPGKKSEIKCLRFGSTGVLWVGTADGLFRYDGN